MADERLNRYVSRAAGVSRRTADELIRAGRVSVDGAEARDPGALIEAGTALVRVDGTALVPGGGEKIYIMMFKPDKVVTTMKDKEGRPTVSSFLPELPERVFPVGRLDYHTTGLLLLTNDGELAYKLTHPRFGVEKTYIAKVMGAPAPSKLGVLRRGLPVDRVMTNPAQVKFIEAREGKAWISIRIAEGRYHQVRKMFEAVGHRVMKLRRVAIGPLELTDVEPGEWRYLTGKEVRELKAYVAKKEAETAAAPPRPERAATARHGRTRRPGRERHPGRPDTTRDGPRGRRGKERPDRPPSGKS